jgi:putative ABC transport system permease protein
MNLNTNEIGSGYFSTLGIPLVSGREFDARDSATAPKVCIINQASADKYFRGRNPIGYRIAFGGGNKTVPDMTIVGVVRNSKHSEVGEELKRFIYTPYMQRPSMNQATFYVISPLDPATLMNTIRGKVQDLDSTLPIAEMKTLQMQIEESLYAQRLMTILSLAFGVLSDVLSGFGIYGVMSYLVSRRTREIGIRIAVGAPLSLVRWMIVREILLMTAAGIALGLPMAFVLGQAAQSMLYGMKGIDISITGAAIVAVSLLALAAGYFPARRATLIDPVKALRNE